jgi:hypothetical protein
MLHSEKSYQSMIARRPDEETPAAPQQAAPSPFADPAEPILRSRAINAEVAERIWNDYHDSRTSADLAKKLANYPGVDDAMKHDLFVAKQKTDAPTPKWKDHLDRAVNAIQRVAQLHDTPAPSGSSVAGIAEQHPNVLRVLADTVLKQREEK